ncbi:MAG: hypothetical protein LKI39_02640 [Bacteroides sp.]|jgi:hypothetical protein|nr:hypothetical protein [Bacteroides sp.]
MRIVFRELYNLSNEEIIEIAKENRYESVSEHLLTVKLYRKIYGHEDKVMNPVKHGIIIEDLFQVLAMRMNGEICDNRYGLQLDVDDVYECILSIAKWDDNEIKERGSERKSSEKRAVIACILSDYRFIQEDISRVINRDRSCVVHYRKNIRRYVEDFIQRIERYLPTAINDRMTEKQTKYEGRSPMG